MTRFARGEGSKASNKKVPEEATPWQEMKAQIEMVKKKNMKKKKTKKFKNNNSTVKKTIFSNEVNLGNGSNEPEAKPIVKDINENENDEIQNSNENNEINSLGKNSKKKKNKKNLSFEAQKKDYIIEDGTKYKVFKNGIKKPWVDLPYEENEIMTRYKTFYVKREMVPILNSFRRSLEDEGLSESEINKKMLRKEEKAHNKLRVELLRQAIKENKLGNGNNSQKNPEEKPKSKKEKIKSNEGEIDVRDSGNHSKKDRSAFSDLVKFDGFFVKKEGAERLKNLREKLRAKGIEENEIKYIMQTERRKEEKILKREKKVFCFRCRVSGHLVSSCPQVSKEGFNDDVQVCYKCGSAEHMAQSCPAKKDNSFSYATCFICGEMGHIAKECPDNPKGLYPNGGGCKECGSVEHLKKDCPVLMKQKEQNTITLSTFCPGEEVETMGDEYYEVKEPKGKKQKSKLIKF